jgi:O-antigen/teichoic acid export membrane protein
VATEAGRAHAPAEADPATRLLDELAIDDAPRGARFRSPASVLIVLAIGLANLSNYGFQVVTGRFLGPREYGLLGGLMAVITVISVSVSSLQTTAAATIASERSDRGQRRLVDPLTKSMLRLGVAIGFVALALSPILARFLDIGVLPVAALAFYIVPAALAAIAAGRLQGLERFTAMAWYSTALAVGKFGLAIAVLAIGLRVTGVVASLVISTACIALAGLFFSREAGAVQSGVFSPEVRRAFVALTLFWIIASTDVPLARAFLSEHEAGLYAAAAVIGKAALWLPAVVAQIAFPRMASISSRGEAATPLMLRALAVAFGLAALVVAALYVFGGTVFDVLYGDEYAGADRLAWRLGLATIPLALANVLLYLHIAREGSRFLIVLGIAAVTQPALLALVGDSGTTFALVVGGVATAMAAALIPYTAWSHRVFAPIRSRVQARM